jgi:hypothetical protein
MSTGSTSPITSAANEAEPGRPSDASIKTLRSRAFGLEVEAGFPISGLPPTREPLSGNPTTVELASMAMLDRDWGPAEPTRLEETRDADGRLVLAIDRDERLGYRLSTPAWGEYILSADGRHLRCAPPELESWRRERFLTGRALPLAATLRGFEVFHASAVSLGGAVVAILGPRHIGKTSVAVNMVLRGASFLTDDLLALETADDHILAHPGAAVMGVREAEYRLIESEQLRRLGQFEQRLDKFFAEVAREERPLPLRIVYFLERRRGTRELAIEEMQEPDPRRLLASSFFNAIVGSPERLRTQLDLCAQLSQTTVLCRASVPPSVGASALAEALEEDATARLGTRAGP